MNKRKLQEFATWAKLNLENQIELSLKQIGINSERDVKRSRVQGDVTIIDGIEKTFNRRFNNQREHIINIVRTDGYKHTIEQFASTWFNRIIAIRFLEIHEYLDHGFKVFPSEPNTLPEILSNLNFVKEDLKLDMAYIDALTSEGNNKEELYRYILFQQCNSLAKSLPMLFSSDMDYLEYFTPTPLLFGDTIINRLLEIEEDDFKEDVEIIGWLYQFYVSFLREETRKKKKTEQNDIPILSQVFTPDWIVKYMAENSIGRIWLESYPNSPLKDEMKYFVNEAEQETEVEEKLKSIRYQNVNPEDIKIIEPCSGSGHILVYCFDLLLKMYQEKGYNKKDIPSLILKNNLVGLDIDQRATQLASFALVMRARSIDNRFFEENRYVRPKVYEIIDSKALVHCDYNGKSYKEIIKEYNSKQWIGENQLTADELKSIDYLVDLFKGAKVIGSLLKVKPAKYLTIRKKLATNFKENTQVDIFTSQFFNNEFKQLIELLRLAYYMSQKYDVMITNPPYISISGLESAPKSYLIKNYPDSKTDMFSMFMEIDYVKKNGFLTLINPDSWMFLTSYNQLRQEIVTHKDIIALINIGFGAFDAVVQTASFIFRNIKNNKYMSTFFKLDNLALENKIKSIKERKNVYLKNIDNFKYVDDSPFIYWKNEKFIENFNNLKMRDFADVITGMTTGNNNLFLRFWFEIDFKLLGLEYSSVDKLLEDGKYWIPYNKGGSRRNWYGNNEYVINWSKKDKFNRSKTTLKHLYLKPGITWPFFTSGPFSARYFGEGYLWDVAGSPCFIEDENNTYYILALMGSVVANDILKTINPTVNFQAVDIEKIPVIIKDTFKEVVNRKTLDNIKLSKDDWDSFETSWDFKKHPLIGIGKLSKLFTEYYTVTKLNFDTLKSNEEELNRIFIDVYGLQGELIPKVEDKYVSISIADKTRDIKSLISYFIGVLMGRYSLVREGIIYAGGTFDSTQYGNYDIDKNGIIPIYSDINVEDGLVHRILGLIKKIYGEDDYRDNVGFIAEALGKKNSETNEETLNRYLNDGFYKDHLKIYQKRPIYWMFSSGKLSGFKALIYMHRYDENTLAKINASYFQPATTILRNQISEIEKLISISGERELNQLNKKRLGLVEQLKEAIEYGQVLDYMANQYISIDLDDGVKVNYEKFQNVKLVSDRGKLTKDLLIPIK